MALENQVEVTIVLDDGSIQKGFAKMEQQAKAASGSISDLFSLKNLAITAAIGSVISVLKTSVHEATNAENTYMKLALSFRNAGLEAKKSADNFLAYSDKLELATGISSELITENAALLVSVGKLSGDGLKKATKAAVDLSAGLGIDLNSAFDLVTKAATGNTTALAKNGIKVSDALSKSEKLAAVIGIVSQKFGGMAEAMANTTFTGAMSKLGTQFGNIFEAIGKFIISSPALKAIIVGIAQGFNMLANYIADLNNSDFTAKIKEYAVAFINLIQLISPPIEIFFRSIRTGINLVYAGIDGLIAVMANVADILVSYILNPLVKYLGNIASAMASVFSDEMGAAIEKGIGDVSNSLESVTGTLADSTVAVFQDSWNKLSESTEQTFNTNMSGSFNKFLENLKNTVIASKDNLSVLDGAIKNTGNVSLGVTQSVSEYFNGMKSAAIDLSMTAQKSFQEMGRSAFNTIGTGIGGAFAAFGKAASKGEDALQAFANSLLNTMGQMAVQLGSQFILQGIAYMWAGMPNGPALIGAGAALAAFGGILSGVGGGATAQGGGTAAATSGGGVASEPASVASDMVNNEPAKIATQVNLTIAGSVYDSEETGMRIVNLINSAFEKQGAVLVSQV